MADIMVRIIDGDDSAKFRYPGIEMMINFFKDFMHSIRDLTTNNMRERFNLAVENDPKIRYFSFGFFVPAPFHDYSYMGFLFPGYLLHHEAGEGANDGLVSVQSSRWGEYLGTLEGDHMVQTIPLPFANQRSIYSSVFERVISNLNQLD